MNIIREENHQGRTIVIGEKPGVGHIGRSRVRQWSYWVRLDNQDVSEHVVVRGMKPEDLLRSTQQLISQGFFDQGSRAQ